MKNIRFFYPKSFIFLVIIFTVYLNRRVFVMSVNVALPGHILYYFYNFITYQNNWKRGMFR